MKQRSWVVAMALAMAGCAHDGKAGTAAAQPAAAAAQPVARKPTSPAIGELLAAVPGDAVALGFVDIDASPWSMLTQGFIVQLDPAIRQALDREMRAYLIQHLGIDPSKLQYAVGYVSVPPVRGAVLLKTVTGAAKIPGATTYNGGQIWVVDRDAGVNVAMRDGVVVCGNDAAVREVLDTMAGKRKPVTAENPALVAALRKETDGAALAMIAVKPKGMPIPPPANGLERLVVSLRPNQLLAAVDGDDAALTAVESILNEGISAGLAAVDKTHDEAVSGKMPVAEGFGAIIGAAYMKSLAQKLKPRREGHRVTIALDLDLQGSGMMTGLSVAGIVAAVAIPSFMDYTKRAKHSEAAVQLNKIGKSAKRVFGETGTFPKGSVSLTPSQACCRGPGAHCPAAPELFAKNTVWRNLDFQLDRPSLFQYDYRASTDGKSFVAHAVGDLDCDGTSISYELKGEIVDGAPRVTLTEPPPNAD